MKNIYLLIVCSLFVLVANAQTGIITGKVVTSEKEAAPGVTVRLNETPFSVVTNDKGIYKIQAPEGHYTLVVSFIGSETRKQEVHINGSRTTDIPTIILKESVAQLNTVVVNGATNKFAHDESDYIAKLPITNLENPQAYTTIPENLMKEQLVVDYKDAFKNLSGSGVPSVANNGRVTISARGFKVRSQIVNGMTGYTMTDIDPANIARIEVIKGPSATLFGSSLTSYGGLVNIVTKQPYDHLGGSASYTAGSWGLNRLTADVNLPLNKEKTALFRTNIASQNEKSSQDAGFIKGTFIAPSFYYQINSRVSVIMDASFYNRDATSPYWLTPFKGTKVRDARDMPLNYDLSFGNNDVSFNARQLNIFAQVNTIISDHWKSSTSFSRTNMDQDGYTLSLNGLTDSTLARVIGAGPINYATMEVQQNFTGNFKLAGMKNRMVLGLDFYQYGDNGTTATLQMDTVNFIHPGSQYGNFNKTLVDLRAAGATYKAIINRQNTYSAYASDVINLTPQLIAMLSLRIDHFQNKGTWNVSKGVTTGKYDQTALSPKFGLVYQLIPDKISLYGNYMNGFENVEGTDFEGRSFKPQQANQWETGIKLDIVRGMLTGTFSYYDILVKDVLRTDPDPTHAGYSVQDGTQRSRGVEVEVVSNPVAGLNIVAGYAYNFSEYVKADDGLKGTRPDGAGPVHTANLWTSYQVYRGKLKGLGIGAGGFYGTQLDNLKGLVGFTVPAYAIVDASLFYDRTKYRLGFKVNNIGDERYWNNRLQLQPSRSFSADITLRF